MSKAKNAGTKWDEDDDVPLAQKLKQTAKPAKPAAPPGKSSPAPPRASDSPAASAAGEKQKKDKELKQRAKTKPDPFPVSRSSGKSSAKEGDALAWAKKNWKVLAVVAAGILFFYFKVISENVRFGREHVQEDPFKVLGVASSASDADIKQVYYKLSLKLHPDKNPDQSTEDAEMFTKINLAYKTLSDPEKRAKWQSGENPEATGIPSDTQTLTDMTEGAYIGPHHAALVLAYSDYSNECWEMADEWEAIGKDLGRYVTVGRFNMEKEPGLAKKFGAVSVPMIYSVVGGKRTPFYGAPTHANVTLFLTKSLADSVAVVKDDDAGSFLEDSNMKPKVMLFAQAGMVKLRMAFRSFAFRYADSIDAAEIVITGGDKLREVYGVTREPSLVFVREPGARPLMYTNKMTHSKMQSLFNQHQHHAVPRLNIYNYKNLCGGGNQGLQPCVLYLHDSSDSAESLARAKAVLLNASTTELLEAVDDEVFRSPSAFAWVDLARQPGVKAALAGAGAHKVVAVDAAAGTFVPYDGEMDAASLVAWQHTFRSRGEGDFDPLAGSMTFSPESRYVNYRHRVREFTPQLMSLVAVIAVYLLWFAAHTIYKDHQKSKKRSKFQKQLSLSRNKVVASENKKLSKYADQEAKNSEAATRKRVEQEEQQKKREEMKAQDVILARKAREADAAAAAVAAAAPPKKAAAAAVSDAELKDAIQRIVAAGVLESLTKRSVREDLQKRYPKLDLLQRKDVVEAEIVAAVTARVEGTTPA